MADVVPSCGRYCDSVWDGLTPSLGWLVRRDGPKRHGEGDDDVKNKNGSEISKKK